MTKATATLGVVIAAALVVAADSPAARPRGAERPPALAGAAGGQGTVSALDAMVEAERAFSRLSGRIGHLPAFLAYFADEVVTFQPAPVAGKEGLRAAAAKASVPPASHLDWEPWFAEVAVEGDLGFTTGPSLMTDIASGKTLRTGWYFSVWKHDALGWRVAADIGVGAPPVGALRPRTVTTGGIGRPGARVPVQQEDLVALERQVGDKALAAGLAGAYVPYLSDATRLYRDGSSPIVGQADVRAYLADKRAPAGWRVVGAGVSASGQLAYAYGFYGVAPTEAPAAAKASFLHVWTRGPKGWTLAADIVNGPPEAAVGRASQ